MKINRTIFRQYDVRGYVNVDLTDDFAYNLARGCASFYKKKLPTFKTVSIGHDARLSSPSFAQAMIKGFNDSGIDTVFLGMIPTGLCYFSMFNIDVQGAVMITGSHNPPEYNGFKVNLIDLPVYGDGIQEIADIMEADDFLNPEKKGTNTTYNIIPDFEKFIFKTIHIDHPEKIKLVVDAGNGVGGFVAVPIMRKMGLNVISIFEEPDGRFPNHHPDPTVEAYIQKMIAAVKENGADLGIGFDGDADRIGIVDRNGKIIWGDKILNIFARSVLEEVPGRIDSRRCKMQQNSLRRHRGSRRQTGNVEGGTLAHQSENERDRSSFRRRNERTRLFQTAFLRLRLRDLLRIQNA